MWISRLNRTDFLKEFDDIPYFEVGAPSARQTVFMIADPKCPFSHRTWEYFKSKVYDKKVKIRIALIPALEGSDVFAREIITSNQPARKWIDSNGGKNIREEDIYTDKESQPWKLAGEYLVKNHEFAKKFGIDRTPFIAYIGKDGNFYSALGMPSNLDDFMSASLYNGDR